VKEGKGLKKNKKILQGMSPDKKTKLARQEGEDGFGHNLVTKLQFLFSRSAK